MLAASHGAAVTHSEPGQQSCDPHRVHEELDRWWDSRWADTRPVGHDLRCIYPDRWVRFHSLPESKRYPESEAEYAVLLARHHAVLTDLGLAGRCFGLAMRFTDDLMPPLDPSEVAMPNAFLWRVVELPDEEELDAAVYGAEFAYPSPAIDRLLRAVADDQEAGVILLPASGDWLYHPYDGGADVIAASAEHRDELAIRFADWLAPPPRGL